MKRASRLAQQRAVGCVLYQCVLEQISRVWRYTLPEQQTSCNEAVKRRSQFRLRLYALPQRTEHEKIRARLPLRSALPPWQSPSRSSRAISEACRLAGRRQRMMEWQQRCALQRLLARRLQHRLGHFLNEQRNAVCALDDVLPNGSLAVAYCQ